MLGWAYESRQLLHVCYPSAAGSHGPVLELHEPGVAEIRRWSPIGGEWTLRKRGWPLVGIDGLSWATGSSLGGRTYRDERRGGAWCQLNVYSGQYPMTKRWQGIPAIFGYPYNVQEGKSVRVVSIGAHRS